MWRWARGIGPQMLLAMGFLSLAPLLGAGFLLLRETETSLQSQVDRHHSQMSQVSASLVRDYIRDASGNLETFAKMVAVGDYDTPEPLQKELDNQRTLAGIFGSLDYYQIGPSKRNFYVNSQQTVFNRGQQMSGRNDLDPSINPQVFQQKFFLEAKDGRPYVAPQFNEVGGLPYLILSVPVGPKEKPHAVLVAHLDFAPAVRMLQHIAGPTRLVELRSGDTILASWGTAPGEPFIETVRPVGHADWKVRVREANVTYEIVRRARRQSVAWLVGAAVLAIVLAMFLSLRILRPVRALTSTAAELGRGNLAVRTGIARADEIGLLASQFDRMAESLQQLDQLKSDFVAHVSHELRTPLTSAKLSLANLQDEVIGPIQPKQKEVVARVRADMDRLIHMVNELLDLARLEAGKVELARESVDLAAVVQQAVETIRPIASQKGITLTSETSPLIVTGDRAKLVQVTLNLLDNAVKFTPSGGTVRVAISGREIAVEDSGPGLPENAQQLFEKFAPRKQPGVPGAGLGLSIARKLMELHGGSIRAENKPGGGARFVLKF